MSEQEFARESVQAALRALGRLPPKNPLALSSLNLVLVPREEGLAEKTVEAGQLATKMVAMRNKLRVLEQRVNASELGIDEKTALHQRITQTYDAFVGLMAFFSDDALPQVDDEQAAENDEQTAESQAAS